MEPENAVFSVGDAIANIKEESDRRLLGPTTDIKIPYVAAAQTCKFGSQNLPGPGPGLPAAGPAGGAAVYSAGVDSEFESETELPDLART
jgi:hypothetical protein